MLFRGVRGLSRKVGVLSIVGSTSSIVAAMEDQLDRFGYEIGSDIELVDPGVLEVDELDAAAADMVSDDVELVLAISTPAALAATAAAEGTDVGVLFIASDPVRSGLVNAGATGVASAEAMEKRVELLTMLGPDVHRLVVLEVSTDRASKMSSLGALLASNERELAATVVTVDDPADAAPALRDHPIAYDAVVLTSSAFWTGHYDDITAEAARQGVPVVGGISLSGSGMVLNYASTTEALGEQTAQIMASALEGTPVSDIPVVTARMELTIDLLAAARAGVDIPPDLLARADHIVGSDRVEP
ncbi:MAG: ABC transporter substrate binding protein [Actinomycetota bacterium]|nr:ABC transporter substrate binding protein [Actinomycetota bacterium]